MAITNLKKTTAISAAWSAIDRVIVNIGQLLFTVILARLLTPEDFGLIALLLVFVHFSAVFVDSGMSSALIQNKDATETDYSTIFIFNLIVSVILYIVLFITAPIISNYYSSPQLIDLMRVVCLVLIFNALSLVPRARLQKKLDIKSLSIANISALILSSTIGLILGFMGFGVWALATQTLLNSIIITLILHYSSSLELSLKFSITSFKKSFKFSFNLLLASLYAQFFQQVTSLIIGKSYNNTQLGFYTQGKTLADSSSGTISTILNIVTFPILSLLQDHEERMLSVFKKMIGMTAFISIPIMVLISIMAEPIILVLFGEKWKDSAPLLQWLALARAVIPISAVNMNILKAIGRSDLFLKVDLAKSPIIIIALFLTVPYSVEAITKGLFISSLISFFINTFIPGRMFGYGALEQIKDMFRLLISTIVMGLSVHFIIKLEFPPTTQLIMGLALAFLTFVGMSYALKIKELNEIMTISKSILFKK